MLRHNFYWSDGRLVKLLLFSTLLDKSPLTFIYFTTFESKRKVRSPMPTQPNFLVFGKISPKVMIISETIMNLLLYHNLWVLLLPIFVEYTVS